MIHNHHKDRVNPFTKVSTAANVTNAAQAIGVLKRLARIILRNV